MSSNNKAKKKYKGVNPEQKISWREPKEKQEKMKFDKWEADKKKKEDAKNSKKGKGGKGDGKNNKGGGNKGGGNKGGGNKGNNGALGFNQDKRTGIHYGRDFKSNKPPGYYCCCCSGFCGSKGDKPSLCGFPLLSVKEDPTGNITWARLAGLFGAIFMFIFFIIFLVMLTSQEVPESCRADGNAPLIEKYAVEEPPPGTLTNEQIRFYAFCDPYEYFGNVYHKDDTFLTSFQFLKMYFSPIYVDSASQYSYSKNFRYSACCCINKMIQLILIIIVIICLINLIGCILMFVATYLLKKLWVLSYVYLVCKGIVIIFWLLVLINAMFMNNVHPNIKMAEPHLRLAGWQIAWVFIVAIMLGIEAYCFYGGISFVREMRWKNDTQGTKKGNYQNNNKGNKNNNSANKNNKNVNNKNKKGKN